MQGYWVRTSVKVELTKEENREIGRHSAPRWELDVVGYNARENTLLVVKCKSYLDSTGVLATTFDGSNANGRDHLLVPTAKSAIYKEHRLCQTHHVGEQWRVRGKALQNA